MKEAPAEPRNESTNISDLTRRGRLKQAGKALRGLALAGSGLALAACAVTPGSASGSSVPKEKSPSVRTMPGKVFEGAMVFPAGTNTVLAPNPFSGGIGGHGTNKLTKPIVVLNPVEGTVTVPGPDGPETVDAAIISVLPSMKGKNQLGTQGDLVYVPLDKATNIYVPVEDDGSPALISKDATLSSKDNGANISVTTSGAPLDMVDTATQLVSMNAAVNLAQVDYPVRVVLNGFPTNTP